MGYERFSGESRPVRGVAPRAQLAIYCEVRQGARPWKVARISDLSETGFKLAWLPEYDQTKPLKVRFAGMEMLTAHIRWVEGKQIGCEFAAPLYVAVFDHIVALAR